MSKRLEILIRSRAKKVAAMDAKIEEHFDSVRAVNGQPLNDKRNGRSTLAKWDNQSDSIRRIAAEIEKTDAAIGRELSAIARVNSLSLPGPILRAIDEGLLSQWRKHPNTFFADGVDKARIVLLDDGRLAHRYVSSITCADQRRKFASVYNALSAELAETTR